MHIMIDIETLGNKEHAVILSLGAVAFTAEEIGEEFHMALDVQQQLDAGRCVDASTIAWWIGQDKAAQEALLDLERHPVSTVLESFQNFVLRNMRGDDDTIWSKGSDFDVVLLRTLYRRSRIKAEPWKFWQARCVRTALMLAGNDVPFEGVKHNALADAIHQAKQVQKFLHIEDQLYRLASLDK